MPKPVCVACGKFYHPKKNGVTIEEGRPATNEWNAAEWLPYKLWRADLYECRSCGHQIVVGFSGHPVHEHYQPEYKTFKENNPPLVFVKDC